MKLTFLPNKALIEKDHRAFWADARIPVRKARGKLTTEPWNLYEWQWNHKTHATLAGTLAIGYANFSKMHMISTWPYNVEA